MLKASIEKIKTMLIDLDYLSNKDDKACELIKHKIDIDDTYSLQLFEELTIKNEILDINKDVEELQKEISKLADVINIEKEMLTFLKNNPSKSDIVNGNIEFKDNISLNLYLDIARKLDSYLD